jgi:hypothetical protein
MDARATARAATARREQKMTQVSRHLGHATWVMCRGPGGLDRRRTLRQRSCGKEQDAAQRSIAVTWEPLGAWGTARGKGVVWRDAG